MPQVLRPQCKRAERELRDNNEKLCKDVDLLDSHIHDKPPGGGGTPLYKLYRYVPPQRVWFFSCFGLKTGIDFDHYGLKSGMVFKGTIGAYKRICLFNSK